MEKETSEKSTEEEEQPEIIRIEKNSRENDGAESIQDKISKGIRDIFGGARKKADEELNEEKESSEEVTETEEDQIPEEIIKTDSTEKDLKMYRNWKQNQQNPEKVLLLINIRKARK